MQILFVYMSIHIKNFRIVTQTDSFTCWLREIPIKSFEAYLNNFIKYIDFQNSRDETSTNSLDLMWALRLKMQLIKLGIK